MTQVFHRYELWEDYLNGMYCGSFDNDNNLIQKAKSLLTDSNLFLKTARNMVSQWPISSEVNLSNEGCNQRAWIGQASCSFLYSIPEVITRKAWNELNDIQRFEANTVAQRVINEYHEAKTIRVHPSLGEPLL
jgi:hypothetical protein